MSLTIFPCTRSRSPREQFDSPMRLWGIPFAANNFYWVRTGTSKKSCVCDCMEEVFLLEICAGMLINIVSVGPAVINVSEDV